MKANKIQLRETAWNFRWRQTCNRGISGNAVRHLVLPLCWWLAGGPSITDCFYPFIVSESTEPSSLLSFFLPSTHPLTLFLLSVYYFIFQFLTYYHNYYICNILSNECNTYTFEMLRLGSKATTVVGANPCVSCPLQIKDKGSEGWK
jgi:hypothetical protein